jgi:hypothetical protein
MYKIEFKKEYKGLMHIVCKSYGHKKGFIVGKVLANKPAFTMPESNVESVTSFTGLPIIPKPTKVYETIRPNPGITQRPRTNRGL